MRKRTPKTKFPNTAVTSYERALTKLIDQVTKEALKLFDKHIAKELHADSENYRIDGLYDELKRMFKDLKNRVTGIFSEKRVERAAGDFVEAVNRTNRHNFVQQARVQGIELVASEPWLKGFVNGHVSNNVSYIKNLEDEVYERIENIVREHIEKGSSSKVIRDAIIEQTNISKSRAQFLAVDQAGSILGQMTAERHQRLGINKFTWDTSGDERVRDEHRELDGKEFYYDDPPIVNGRQVLPGEDYRCRCVAMPVFDDD
ncbi:phage head morphogenesis protein [Lysinibacillus sp. 54212]|uniref:phage head morphogenesis protein n=1 Tax=Lysinibacillus sp. 54212 TaxID=3119829 RepID=UPI002FC66EDE